MFERPLRAGEEMPETITENIQGGILRPVRPAIAGGDEAVLGTAAVAYRQIGTGLALCGKAVPLVIAEAALFRHIKERFKRRRSYIADAVIRVDEVIA